MTRSVYHLRFWMENEDRPWIDFELPQPGVTSWMRLGKVLNGEAPASDYSVVRLAIRDARAADWHSYEVAGTYGLLSKAVIDLIGRHMTKWFDLLEAWVNDIPFCFLRKKRVLDCLDHDHSVLVPFPSEPDTIMRIDRYCFHKERIPDPAVFPIPEMKWNLFATDSIKREIEARGLKGLYFSDAEV